VEPLLRLRFVTIVRGAAEMQSARSSLGFDTLIDVSLDVGSLPPRSSSPTVAGCRLGGFSVGSSGGRKRGLV